MNIPNLIIREICVTLKRPLRIKHVVSPAKISAYLRILKAQSLSPEKWENQTKNGVGRRKVKSYGDYIDIQTSKLEHLNLASHETKFRRILANRLQELNMEFSKSRTLCLGARLGAEVAAFRDLGSFAIGVDLNPGKENPYVCHGDFHNLAFPDHCCDYVYTNSIDHAFDLSKVFAEIKRILQPDGYLILELDPGTGENDLVQPDVWQTISWQRVDDMIDCVKTLGFSLIRKTPFTCPRGGTQTIWKPI